MKALYNTETGSFKTYDGWTTLQGDPKAPILTGIENIQLFTKREAEMNVLDAPLVWRHVNPRIKWRMLK